MVFNATFNNISAIYGIRIIDIGNTMYKDVLGWQSREYNSGLIPHNKGHVVISSESSCKSKESWWQIMYKRPHRRLLVNISKGLEHEAPISPVTYS